MVDNIDVTPGSGKTIAADDVGGSLHQRVKVTWGPDGTGNDADTANGKPLPIQIRSATGLVPVGEPTDDKSSATDTTSVSLISLVKQVSAYLGTLSGAVGSSKVATKAASGDFADGAIATLGAQADDKSTATDTTAVSGISIWKQISASVQSLASGIVGSIAHDSADSGNPVKVGAKATTSLSGLTLVSDADRTNIFAGVDGVQIFRPHCNLEDIVSAVVTCTAGANTSIISSQGAGVKFYLTSVILRNGGSSNGNCIITDGTGGTTKLDIPFPASTGAIYNPPVPIPFSAATAVYANPSGSDDIIVTIVGFKSKV